MLAEGKEKFIEMKMFDYNEKMKSLQQEIGELLKKKKNPKKNC